MRAQLARTTANLQGRMGLGQPSEQWATGDLFEEQDEPRGEVQIATMGLLQDVVVRRSLLLDPNGQAVEPPGLVFILSQDHFG